MKRISFLISLKTSELYLLISRLVILTIILLILEPTSTSAQIFTKLASVTNNGGSTGSGWIDYNKDGMLDAYNTYFNINNRLYSNNGDGSFQLITSGDIIPQGSNFSGIAWGDYDNDGNPDLYITSMSGANILYRNLGDGHFERIVNSATTKDGGSFLSCNWVDYNNDGYLDLFVTASGTSFTPGSGNNNLLYKNNGDGTFTKITDIAITSQKTFSNCAGFADIDNDGDQDLFLTEWGKNNWLFENNGDGTFSKIDGTEVNTNKNISITCSWGDYDNDGYLDLFVGNGSTSQTVKQQNYLFHNNGNKTFNRITSGEIAEYSGCVWTSAWGDVDNDGDLDLYLGTIYEKEELLFLNNGDGTFTKTHEFGVNNRDLGTGITGASFGDYDNDGFIDLLVADAGSNENLFIYHNNGNGNNWLSITCKGKISNSSAIGTRVKVKSTIFGKTFWQVREIHGVNGFRGSDDLRVHFGLGDATIIDSLVIIWPSKQITVQKDIPVNQFINIKEPVPTGYIKPNFNADKFFGYSPLQVKFTDCSVCDDEHPITSWSWDFNGDGIEDSNEKNPVYIYDVYSGGVFPVSLTISNGHESATIKRENYINITPMYEQNIALKKTATASSFKTALYLPKNATDGSSSTRWLSAVSDTEWIQIEMDSVYLIGKIRIKWGTNYAVQYKISGSENGNDWFEMLAIDNGRGATETHQVNSFRAKFIKIDMLNSANKNGFGIYEIEVYRPEITDIEDEVKILMGFSLQQNYPNPFNPSTVITYQLPRNSHVTLKVYDVLGREVATLVDGHQTAGSHLVTFSAGGLPSGVYLYRLQADNYNETKKLLLLK